MEVQGTYSIIFLDKVRLASRAEIQKKHFPTFQPCTRRQQVLGKLVTLDTENFKARFSHSTSDRNVCLNRPGCWLQKNPLVSLLEFSHHLAITCQISPSQSETN
jgi:hypothetical protein